MRKSIQVLGAVIALGGGLGQPVFAQTSPADLIAARCEAEHFGKERQQACEAEQRSSAADFGPVADFIAEGEYIVQTLALGDCIKSTRDEYGQDHVALAACYDETVTQACEGNGTCLGNSTIAGIKQHIAEGTKP